MFQFSSESAWKPGAWPGKVLRMSREALSTLSSWWPYWRFSLSSRIKLLLSLEIGSCLAGQVHCGCKMVLLYWSHLSFSDLQQQSLLIKALVRQPEPNFGWVLAIAKTAFSCGGLLLRCLASTKLRQWRGLQTFLTLRNVWVCFVTSFWVHSNFKTQLVCPSLLLTSQIV